MCEHSNHNLSFSAPKPTFAEKARQSIWLLVLEGLAILVTIFSVLFLGFEMIEAQKERKAEALARSWQILTTPAPGNSGKVEALEYLANQRQSLRGIDISCETMGGIKINKKGGSRHCKSRPYLQHLNLSEEKLGFKVELVDADLNGANLMEADLSGANIKGADFSRAELMETDLTGANLWGVDLSRAKLEDAKLIEAILWDADLRGARLGRANFREASLNGTNFSNTIDIGTSKFQNAWAWADNPPIGLPSDIDIQLCQFDLYQHRRFEKPDPCIPPEK